MSGDSGQSSKIDGQLLLRKLRTGRSSRRSRGWKMKEEVRGPGLGLERMGGSSWWM